MYMKSSLGTRANSLSLCLKAEEESEAAEEVVVLNVHGPCASHTVPGTVLVLCVCECSQQCIEGRVHTVSIMSELLFV